MCLEDIIRHTENAKTYDVSSVIIDLVDLEKLVFYVKQMESKIEEMPIDLGQFVDKKG